MCVVCYVKLSDFFFFSHLSPTQNWKCSCCCCCYIHVNPAVELIRFSSDAFASYQETKVNIKKTNKHVFHFLTTWKMCQKCEKHSNSTGYFLDARTLIVSPIPEVWSGIDQVWSFGTIFTQCWQRNIKNRHILLHFFGIII